MGNIYYLTDDSNIPKYIGATKRKLNLRLYQHRWSKKNGSLSNIGDNIRIVLIENCEDDILDEREIYWIKYYKDFLEISNISPGGKLISEETKIKISKTEKGKKVSEETKLKLSIINTGKKLSEETISKRSKTVTGKKKKPYNVGTQNHFYGKKHSEETKLKMKQYWENRRNKI